MFHDISHPVEYHVLVLQDISVKSNQIWRDAQVCLRRPNPHGEKLPICLRNTSSNHIIDAGVYYTSQHLIVAEEIARQCISKRIDKIVEIVTHAKISTLIPGSGPIERQPDSAVTLPHMV